jgi:hypothetical protein
MQYGDEETDKYASKVQKVDFFSYYIILIFDRTEVLIVFSTEIHSASTWNLQAVRSFKFT